MTAIVPAEPTHKELHGRPFASLYDEFDYQVHRIEGTLPPDLTGTLFRIGPGKFEVGDTVLKTMLDADGMVSRFILDGRSVRFTNRYVRTRQYRGGDRMTQRGITTNAPTLRGNLKPPANTANTNMVSICGELLALWEGGPPHKIDPDSLDTLGYKHFDGDRLGYLGAFSAHPKWDPRTGEVFNFGLDLFPTPRLRCFRVDRFGRNTQINSLPLWDMVWNHDFALTPRHLVFVLDPLRPNIPTLLRTRSLAQALDYQARNGSTRFVLVPRDGAKPRVIEHEALAHVHVTNAFEDGGDTVVEFFRFDDPEIFRKLGKAWQEPADSTDPRAHLTIDEWPRGHLSRFRINKTGRITETVLSATAPMEFPQYDWRRSTREHNVTYAAAATADIGHYNAVTRIDHRTGTQSTFDFGLAQTGEPLFVPRSDTAAEDDGWLLVLNHDLPSHRSQLVIFDARTIADGPLASAHLEHHLPIGFHGTFSRKVAGLRTT
ncbi:MAG: carotenoid oxygenase family protein [Mycobacterium sp.]